MKASHRNENATITVYLSLILLMILSLIFTIIEGARISTANVFAERALSTATDSVLADFYGPLWEEYHLFGYDTEEGGVLEKADRLEEALTEYMSYTLTPDKNLLQEKKEESLKLLGISLSSIEVEEQTRLMDYKGELFRNEAVEYMKYDTAADTIEVLLDKLSLLETPKKVGAIYEEKLKAEEKLAEIDRSILRLMELSDGLCTSKKGIRLDKNGKLKIKEYFIKKLYTGELTADKVSINNNTVFQAWKKHYSNPADSIRVTQQRLIELEEVTLRIREIDEAIQNTEEEGSGDAIDNLHSKQAALTAQKQELIQAVQSDCQKLDTELEEILPLIREAIVTVEKITDGALAAAPLIENLEQKLSGEEDSLGEDIMQELFESLAQMKQYSEESKTNTGYHAMKDILEENQSILLEIRPLLSQCASDLKNENYSDCRKQLDSVLMQLKHYRVTELSLDYSTLVTERGKTEDPVEAVRDVVKNSLTALVIDPATVSENKLSEGRLPSMEAELLLQDSDFGTVITDFIEDFTVGGNTSGMQNIMKSFTDTDALLTMLSSGLNKASDYLLFREYLKEHFETYPAGSKEVAKRKPAALTYEQEYLLYGRLADRDNLSSLVGRLIFLRMSADFVTLLGDRVRVQEALAAATALVGFTSLPILISITKTVLLLIWSFAEALVDVCALMQGMEVPVLKKTFVLTFPEMFALNRNYLQTKVPMLEQSKLSLSYGEYLYLFLLLHNNEELAYHSMDLIQENINLRYDDAFYFTDCLYGFSVKAEFSTATKFIAVPIIINYLKHSVLGYGFQYRMENSY